MNKSDRYANKCIFAKYNESLAMSMHYAVICLEMYRISLEMYIKHLYNRFVLLRRRLPLKADI